MTQYATFNACECTAVHTCGQRPFSPFQISLYIYVCCRWWDYVTILVDFANYHLRSRLERPCKVIYNLARSFGVPEDMNKDCVPDRPKSPTETVWVDFCSWRHRVQRSYLCRQPKQKFYNTSRLCLLSNRLWTWPMMTCFRARYPPVHIVRRHTSNAKKSAPWKLVLSKSMFKFQIKVKTECSFGVCWGKWLRFFHGLMNYGGWKLAQISFIPCLFIIC